MVYLIVILSISNLLSIFYILHQKKEINKILSEIERTIDAGISGNINVFEESISAKIIDKIYRFVDDHLSIKTELVKEKEHIQSLIGDISHQTKTPISNISIYLELLDENYNKEYLKIIKDENDKLKFLIEALIKSSRLETGLIQLNKEKLNIIEMLESTLLELNTKRDICIENTSNNVDIKLDYRWTKEAVFNILDNALKYSDEDSKIQIKISNTEIYLKVDIASRGKEILESEYTKIFQRFFRGENSMRKDGIGIGLFLSKEIIQSQDGYIVVQSKDNINTFSLYFRY